MTRPSIGGSSGRAIGNSSWKDEFRYGMPVKAHPESTSVVVVMINVFRIVRLYVLQHPAGGTFGEDEVHSDSQASFIVEISALRSRAVSCRSAHAKETLRGTDTLYN
jgi:hypothetical protein